MISDHGADRDRACAQDEVDDVEVESGLAGDQNLAVGHVLVRASICTIVRASSLVEAALVTTFEQHDVLTCADGQGLLHRLRRVPTRTR